MHNARKRPRKNTPHVVKALEQTTGTSLGRVVDVTADGMMLVTDRDLEIGQRFAVRLNLPVMVQYRTDVELEAVVRWTTPDTNADFKKVGLEFVSIDDEDGLLLEDVMHKLNLVG